MTILEKFLKRCRDYYYVSQLLAYFSRPVRFLSLQVAEQIQRKVRKNGVTIRLPNGKEMSIGRNTGIGIASRLFWHGLDGYEPDTSQTLRFMFERASTFVDAGANCGLYSVMGALWNPNLKVIAFEPVPVIFSGLQKNVLLNRLESRVRCENVALSSRSGRATLFLPEGEGLDIETTGTLVSDSWQRLKGSPAIEVEAARFDDYEAAHPMRVDLIKIDVEDFEADVLEGMRRTILRDRPFIVCEILPRPHGNKRTYEIAQSLNYQPYWITPVGYVKTSSFDLSRLRHTDFLLSPVSTRDAVVDSLEVLWELKKSGGKALQRLSG
jgi:FkbM family methyltransferase